MVPRGGRQIKAAMIAVFLVGLSMAVAWWSAGVVAAAAGILPA